MMGGRPIRGARALGLSLFLCWGVALAENLTQAWDTALAHDRGVRAAARETDAARAGLDAARGARHPRLQLESGYTVLDHEPAARVDLPPLPISQIPQAEDQSLSYSATVTVPLYTGGRITRGIDAAQAGLDAAAAQETRAVADLKLEVGGAYLDVLRARRGVEVVERAVASLEAHAADAERLFQRGMVARNHLLAAKVALADARQRAIQAHNRLDLAHAAYNRLLGRALTETVELAEIEAHPVTEHVEALTTRALTQRPELRAAALQSTALRHQSAAERAAGSPQMQFGLGVAHQDNRYQVHETLRSATLGVRWELYDGGVIRAQAESVAQRAQALTEHQDDLRTQVALQVRQAWLDEQETEKRVPVAREALDQSEENLRVARTRYREGIGTNTEVLDAESQRTQSYTNYYSAVYDAVHADLRLRHAVGEL